MKKAISLLLLIVAFAGTTFASGHIIPSVKKTEVVLKKKHNNKKEKIRMYTYITSCGPWVMYVPDDAPEIGFFNGIGIWASFEIACLDMAH